MSRISRKAVFGAGSNDGIAIRATPEVGDVIAVSHLPAPNRLKDEILLALKLAHLAGDLEIIGSLEAALKLVKTPARKGQLTF